MDVQSPTLKKSKEGSVLGGKRVQQQIKDGHEGGEGGDRKEERGGLMLMEIDE
ncbi:hypothetical protein NQZ68_019299 [Dissostichus eleginoides]|nr:hypothetical protein NQZ68_019299 [Dissostichus eleginoides]